MLNRSMRALRSLLLVAVYTCSSAEMLPAPTRLRVEYLGSPISVDHPTPRFSWALPQHGIHSVARLSMQSAYQLIVLTASLTSTPTVVWDSGVVTSNKTLNIPFGGTGERTLAAEATIKTPLLHSDTDYIWTVVWINSHGVRSAAARSTFTVAILSTSLQSPDWHGASWISSPSNGSLSTYRTEFELSANPVRARLYVIGLGYAKTWINGNLTDTHELGQYVTFQKRVLYDCIDVVDLLRTGKNALGIVLGHGWLKPRESSPFMAPRQFLILLSLTAPDGDRTYLHSATAPAQSALTFVATEGPARTVDMFRGEVYDGRLAVALAGWSTPGYIPSPKGPRWVPAIAPAVGPQTWKSQLSAHHASNIILTKQVFAATDIREPAPGIYVFDFAQNMAGQVTLSVSDCPAGTVISMQHAEVLHANGLVRNSFCIRRKYWLCGLQQFANYTCSGAMPVETYRVRFTSMGFRYVQVVGFPGVPTVASLKANFIHSDVPQTGEFRSSSPLLNAIQHATLFSAAANQMDIPTDCPQRERQGWLGDAQLVFDTIQHNFDGGAFYSKWVRDLGDVQSFNTLTRDADGAMPDTCPFYSSSSQELEADPGWGIAAWFIPTAFSSYYDDDRLERAFYPHQRAYMEHWVKLAQNNSGELPATLQHSGDWGCMQPGPTDCAPIEYSHFFYVKALALQADCATRLGIVADAARYGGLVKAARELYVSKYFNNKTGCFGNCTDISQIFGLTLTKNTDLLSSKEESMAWAKAVSWFGEDGKFEGRFGGGIVSLKFLYPLLDDHGMSDLGLKFQLHTDKPPSFGFWIAQGATTLFEYWGNSALTTPTLLNSYNHIMYGSSGSWYYSTLAGLKRAPGSRSWRDLIITPPPPGSLSNLTWVNASIDTPIGLVGSAWSVSSSPETQGVRFEVHAVVPSNAHAKVVMPVDPGLVIQEGGVEVWSGGGFRAGAVIGVVSAEVEVGGDAVRFNVGSGAYLFTVNL